MPLHFCNAVSKFLQLPDATVCRSVNGKRVNRCAGYRLEIPVTLVQGRQRTIALVKKAAVRELTHTNNKKKKCLK